MTAALLLLAVAVALWVPGSAVAGERVRRVTAPGPPATGAGEAPAAGTRRRWLLAGTAGLATGLLLGGGVGACAAVVVTGVGERLLRTATPDRDAEERAVLLRELPVACELLAACLGAGLPLAGALAAVAGVVPGPLGRRLHGVAALHRMGAAPRRAWADQPAELGGLARVLVRSGESGAAAVPALHALAGETRSAARTQAQAAVQRAGVWVLAPLGLCFLPAFVCLGVVPLVLGIAGDVFG
ncbi:type II secretion system F family protein [Blastococcus sp. BMG 814]|uniref:Type II secretion system F family protein n=1 Tax=Blastococcus carthaginiensis TaxID=3050034 RepID=A0ABT9IEQ5_9ACTN|nr:type II secretion system F family protein [Blastococcus carthaginiensis]MDP5184051.1 type II secretion system F family protein [Blastococcus carthaginiensis]